MQGEVEKIEHRLAEIKKWRTRSTKLDDDDENSGPGTGGAEEVMVVGADRLDQVKLKN